MICRCCGFHNSNDAKYCGGCGHRLVQKGHFSRKCLPAVMILLVITLLAGIMIPKKTDAAQIRHVLPLEEFAQGLDLTEQGKCGKCILIP